MNFSTFTKEFCLLPTFSTLPSKNPPSPDCPLDDQQRLLITKDCERFLQTTPANILQFRSGIRSLAHPVTCQALHPLQSTAKSPTPISYFEVTVQKLSDKDVTRAGFGLAKLDHPFLKVAGFKDSVAIRGDAKIYVNEVEEKQQQCSDKTLGNSKVGVGYIARTGTVFFTLNGREVH